MSIHALQPRAVRIALDDAIVSFDHDPVSLVNISRTGALLRVHGPATVGRAARLVITHNHTTIQLDAEVVRTGMAGTAGHQDEGDWQAGVRFVAPPPTEIIQLLKRIIPVS